MLTFIKFKFYNVIMLPQARNYSVQLFSINSNKLIHVTVVQDCRTCNHKVLGLNPKYQAIPLVSQ